MTALLVRCGFNEVVSVVYACLVHVLVNDLESGMTTGLIAQPAMQRSAGDHLQAIEGDAVHDPLVPFEKLGTQVNVVLPFRPGAR